MNLGSKKLGPLRRGRPTRKQRKAIKSLLEEYYCTGMITSYVSKATGFNRKTINRYFRQFSTNDA